MKGRYGSQRYASGLQIRQCSNVPGAVGKWMRCLKGTAITTAWLEKSEPSKEDREQSQRGSGMVMQSLPKGSIRMLLWV